MHKLQVVKSPPYPCCPKILQCAWKKTLIKNRKKHQFVYHKTRNVKLINSKKGEEFQNFCEIKIIS